MNVVVVVLLDSLNRHMLGCYGGNEFDTPNLDRFARERRSLHAIDLLHHALVSLRAPVDQFEWLGMA